MSAFRSSYGIGAAALALAATLAACGGGGSTGGAPPVLNPIPVPTSTPVSTQQLVTMALPTTSMGARTDAVYGVIGGYTQQQFSQTLAFAPGSQIMITNGQAGTPHTFGVVSTTSFDSGAALNTSPTGGNTIQAGFNTGSVNGDTSVGPFTLAAGLYYIGCAFHYQSNQMRTVLNVAANATPGPQATLPPGDPTPPPGGGFGY
ncbi:MAG TPA: hypothetical protein VHS78_18840 [Candidatus Elarobacter sp.]|jgi:hypothetical protein|nr:hypothetical protein [Candidatus Elarobacter sp.]